MRVPPEILPWLLGRGAVCCGQTGKKERGVLIPVLIACGVASRCGIHVEAKASDSWSTQTRISVLRAVVVSSN